MKKKLTFRFAAVLLVLLLLAGVFPTSAFADFPYGGAEVSVAAPVFEAPVIDLPAVDLPVIEAPVIDLPAVDLPVIEAPVIDLPAVDLPVIEAPVIDLPVIDVPVVDASAAAAMSAEAAQNIAVLTASTDSVSFTLSAPAAGMDNDERFRFLTININNIIHPKINNVSGHAVAGESQATVDGGTGDGVTASKAVKAFYGNVTLTGDKFSTSSYGVKYEFQRCFVLGTGPKYSKADSVPDSEIIDRIYYKNNGEVKVKFKDGNTKDVDPTVERDADGNIKSVSIDICPVYSADPEWLLEENYVDNVSTGSGSWSSLDAVTSYEHTFKKPDEPEDYRFEYWMGEDGVQYREGDKLIIQPLPNNYSGWTGTKPVLDVNGNPREVPYLEQTTYAWWQPAVNVLYFVNGDEAHREKSFDEDIKIYDYTPEVDIEGVEFEGWYEDENFENRYAEDAVAELPEVTKEKGFVNTVKAYARFVFNFVVSKFWDDGDDADGLRPDSVDVDLYAGQDADRQKVESATLNEEGGWKHIFEKLTAFDGKGNRITYSAEESQVPRGYTAEVKETENGVEITNSHTPTPEPDPEPDPEPKPEPPVIPDIVYVRENPYVSEDLYVSQDPGFRVTKEVRVAGTEPFLSHNEAELGEMLQYRSTITLSAYGKNVVLHDVMDPDLSFDGNETIRVCSDAGLTQDINAAAFRVLETPDNGDTFTLAFDDAWLAGLTGQMTLYVTYTAHLKETAVEDQYNRTSLCSEGVVLQKDYTWTTPILKEEA